ncbi:MAG: V-type ATP synthase subunit D [Candidatus Margulisbacteria bacterium]|jgi:V/A-type H+-transporting ATPase subunit D|nr:V-type ATP synthase subunit D [Candidatus Margulisiibacteriota bacterium]
MAKLNVNPNRMELLKLKSRLQFARRGHKLLKDKQESLMQEFMRILKELRGLYEKMNKNLDGVYAKFYQAQAGANPYALEEALLGNTAQTTMAVEIKSQFGVKFPVLRIGKIEPKLGGSPATAPLAARGLVQAVGETFPAILFLAQTEKKIELLAEEIEKTRRRVNALEYNLIPVLQETQKDIVLKLEERDRSERTKLMKVKDLIAAG